MLTAAQIMANILLMKRLHDGMLREACGPALSLIEDNIICFLQNNPGHDTAADIVDLRGLSKGNVSGGVEKLIQKGLLARVPDPLDRRVIHLKLTPAAREIARATARVNSDFSRELMNGFTEDELAALEALLARRGQNINNAAEKRKIP